MSRRSDMRLEDITGILPWITLVDAFSETEISFRLAGTMIREIMGFELTDRHLLEMMEPGYRASRGARGTHSHTALWRHLDLGD
ncbi:MAG: PAS domain-containing protein [Alphaproteobacteria bacterium]|nr:hypothetical protein [Rhodospirillaceae bacterium]MDP6022043.1 PAS domain-containing protein [Alphaproteobacteria bacterium]